MDAAAVIRKHGSTVLGGLGVVLWLAALYLLCQPLQSDLSSHLELRPH